MKTLVFTAFLYVSADSIKNAASNGQMSMPLQYCDSNGCSTKWTGLIIDEGNKPSTNYGGHGVSSIPNGVQMSMQNGGSRMYLTDESGNRHFPFQLNNKVLTFDVDVSQMQCGFNAALYFSQMNLNTPIGKIDLTQGTGYCDAQGTCTEFDVFEANAAATQVTSHSCTGSSGNCDHWGCGRNSRSLNVFGPYRQFNSMQPFTVSTYFRATNGVLTSVDQTISQNGQSVSFPAISDSTCGGSGDPQFPSTGELEAMSSAFNNGMTLVFSIWGSGGNGMSWLDGGYANNDCNTVSHGSNTLKFYNLSLRSL
ncbi:hypothetical protein HK103_006039 [Boothiomyces macroporosus]|uniref:Glucanase n=1 Tax=Boothiomyces macroporosus TaxID=261099 RepID=A0AAD5Y4Y0_9FUNG|nr:hypothetical protein HK103_006039 [Boothiomyces macroporosus]